MGVLVRPGLYLSQCKGKHCGSLHVLPSVRESNEFSLRILSRESERNTPIEIV